MEALLEYSSILGSPTARGQALFPPYDNLLMATPAVLILRDGQVARVHRLVAGCVHQERAARDARHVVADAQDRDPSELVVRRPKRALLRGQTAQDRRRTVDLDVERAHCLLVAGGIGRGVTDRRDARRGDSE